MKYIFLLLSGLLLIPISCKKETSYSLEYDLAILEEVNKYRESKGLIRLEHDDFLWETARSHSNYLANLDGDANHDNRDERFNAIKYEYGLGNIAENVASGEGTASEVVQAWLLSTSHTNNMDGDFNISAVSAVRSARGTYYYTQIFYKQSSQ